MLEEGAEKKTMYKYKKAAEEDEEERCALIYLPSRMNTLAFAPLSISERRCCFLSTVWRCSRVDAHERIRCSLFKTEDIH